MVVLSILEWSLFFLISWTFAIASAGFLPIEKTPRPNGRRLRFLVLIPAHNEERVIGEAIRALLFQDYPRHLFEIVVVADMCFDRTAERARAAGADIVLERNEPSLPGKGEVLAWALDPVRGLRADAVTVFDADNIMSSNFLNSMDRRLQRAHIVQGRVETKNPDDSWLTEAGTLGQTVSQRLFQRSRARLGWSVNLAGTGYAIRYSTLRAYPPDPRCLVDDIELRLRLLREGIRVDWAPEAITWDEKPASFAASFRQRLRWARGQIDVRRRHTLSLLRRAFFRADLAAWVRRVCTQG